ncbi:MAG: phosphoesterase RecJ domain protein [Candidatus Saccharibacteria bacterium]|nr:phosphoesterase RecJ domain protein [Candidatus Saccharibacteria bacterium]
MEDQIFQLKKLLEDAENILVTSHISPDPDAVCSSLLIYLAIKTNYPDKKIKLVLEEKPSNDLSFLQGYEQIEFVDVAETLRQDNPDLVIVADAGKLNRCSRNPAELHEAKLVIIDHHEPDDKDDADVYVNNGTPAATQEVYNLLFEKLGWTKPEGYQDIALLGILADTFRFRYRNPLHRETFRIVSDLLDAGASIEVLESKLNRYTKPQLEILGHLAANAVVTDQGFSYSWLYDEYVKDWLGKGNSVMDLKNGCEIFVNQFVRNLNNNLWGFIVYPDLAAGEGSYSVSFRSASGVRNVQNIAKLLGGGGHVPAAGAKFQAANMQEAINKVLKAIENTPDS